MASEIMVIVVKPMRVWFIIVVLLMACAVTEVNGPVTVKNVSGHPGRQVYYLVVTSRKDASQSVFIMKPTAPAATVILFTGGNGQANVSPIGASSGNFLIRSQMEFFNENLMVAIVGPPSDRSELSDHFRHSEAHAIDIKGVISELRKLADVPVWAVGTSNGSASVANIASRFQPKAGPDGIVLTSSVMTTNMFVRGVLTRASSAASVFDAHLKRIRVPTLVVHHKEDACVLCPYSGAIRLESALSGSTMRELIGIDGGASPHGDPCDAYHYHGFVGREREVVRIISDWIKAHPPK